jgi:hypothetical protein
VKPSGLWYSLAPLHLDPSALNPLHLNLANPGKASLFAHGLNEWQTGQCCAGISPQGRIEGCAQT